MVSLDGRRQAGCYFSSCVVWRQGGEIESFCIYFLGKSSWKMQKIGTLLITYIIIILSHLRKKDFNSHNNTKHILLKHNY